MAFQIPTFCINLDNRHDRWRDSKEIFKKNGVDVTRFSAIKNVNYPYLGATSSHRKIISIAQKKGYDMVCVLEDDIKLAKNFLKTLQLTISKLPNDWHILYLGGLICRDAQIKKINKEVSKISHITCAYGVVYNKKCYENFLNSIKNKKTGKITAKYKSFDDWLAFNYQKIYPCYVSNKILVDLRPSYSDIERKNTSTGLWYRIRFFFYLNHLGWILNGLGKIKDFFHPSARVSH